MNFVGKFDGKLHLDGSGAHPDAPHHVNSASPHAASDTIIVPDADLLFHGDFKRSGVDLIVSRDDHELVVQDYFKGEKRAALASPDGARLTADIINALAGHVEVAQADGSAGAGKVIGHVTKLVGTATAIRNGVSIILNQGDNVEKGDVVQSGSGSTLGVTFIDGTVFGLSSNARMVLNEMVYDPNGSDNSALISLVAGTISFVAGQTAKHGDMKVDTPVATMGIRGTAVLVEIDFDVPGQNGMPEAKFQVLVEPDGTTGSYILFDKSTLAPIAIVDKAGQRIDISNNNVSISDSAFTPELQKLITDVFTLKFSATNPQTLTHFADTLTPQQTWLPVQLANNGPPQLVHLTITPIVSASGPSFSAPLPSPIPHLDVPPAVTTVDISSTERAGITGSSAIDTTSGTISFADINLGDRPTATATFSSFSYQNAQHQSIAPTVQELADIQTLEQIPLVVVQAPGNTSNGTATWTLNVPDRDFDFLGAGDTLTLTYMAKVDSNYAAGNLVTLVPFTVTITGTNDAPVITTGPEKVAFINVGTSTTGPNLPPPTGPTTNTLAFKDPDLTDTHTVATDLTAATLSGTGISTLDMQALEAKFPRPMGVFESALSAAVTTDSSGTGTGTITWTLADISAYYADIVPAGETLTLTYTVTVKDSQGATSSQNVIVTITGSDAAAVVWVETTATAATDAAPGDWNGANNWETGTVPTASDDVIIITNQLQGQTPFYPVTIEAAGAAAFAHSLTMNDYGTLFTNSPTLINHNTLTVGAGGISLSADAILENFGTLSVGGLAEFLQEASLQNSGLLTLQDGGDFNDSGSYTDSHGTIHSGSITNSGTIEVAGGTLTVEVAVDNAGGTIQVDSGETLRLNGAAIDGGTVTGNVDVTGNSSINGTSTGTPAVTTDATLVNSAVTVESGVILTLDNVTAIATTITDKGTIVLDDTVKLSDGATIEGVSGSALGAITNNGTLEVAGAAELLDDTLTNTSGIIQIDDSQTLTLSGAEIVGGIINDFSGPLGGKIDVTGNSKIDGGATLNNGAVTLESNVTLTLDNVTVTGTTFNDTASGATLSVDFGANLNFAGATVSGGLVNIGGQLDSTGISAITDVSITNTGLIEATSGVLTIDPATALTLTNSGMLEANGGELDITSELVANTGTLRAIDNSTLKLTTTTVTNSGAGTVTVASGSTLDLASANIDGGTVGNSGIIDNVSGSNTISGLVTNTGIIEVKAGTLDLSGGLSGAGSLIIDAGATLELAGADAQTISFAGGIGTLQLDHALGFTGTIAGTSSTGGTFTITGAGDITSASGDAIDFTASGGVAGNEADVTLTPSGAITGAANGIVVVQNGAGDITVDPSGNVVGHAGDGVIAEDSATGTGNIFVNGGTGSATGTGTGSVGLLAENLNAANAGDITVTQLGGASGALFGIEALTEGNGDVSVEAAGAITAAAQYGIRAASSGTGDITVKTDAGTVINSGGAGIVAVNEASTVPSEADSTIIVTAYGTINSGTALTVTGSVPAGILAGYLGGDVPPSGFPLTGVNGDVTVNNYADITAAAGDGIRAYNYGIGDVTVNDDAGSIVALGGTSPVNGYGNGISADNFGTGDVNVTTTVGITIDSGGSGIVANNAAAAAPSSQRSLCPGSWNDHVRPDSDR